MLTALGSSKAPNAPVYGHVTCPDGLQMAYTDQGIGPVLLLLHGWGVDGSFFAPLQDRLAQSCRIVTPDLRAHGQTTAGDSELRFDTLAGDLHTLIETLDLGDVTLLGWSMGAMVAWRYIERQGTARLAGLVVEDMSPRIVNDEHWRLGVSSGMSLEASDHHGQGMISQWPDYAASFAPRMFARSVRETHPDLVQAAVEGMAAQTGADMSTLWDAMARQDFRAMLPAIDIPTLIVFGELSQVYGPESGAYLADLIPNAKALGFAHSGHAPHLEEPEEFARAVSNFVQTACKALDTRIHPEGRKS